MRKFLLVLIFLCSLASTVYAHPGRTDSNGGHNSSDGYHYHHGYSAHDHKDMDGDGDLDCPYDFKDNVDSSDSSGSGIDHDTNDNATTEYSIGLSEETQKRLDALKKQGLDNSLSPSAPTPSYGENNSSTNTNKTSSASNDEASVKDILIDSVVLVFLVLVVLGWFASFFSKKIGTFIVGCACMVFLILMLIYPLTFLLE